MARSPRSSAAPETLLLGLGNPILRDDSIGIRLARDIAARLGNVPGLQVVDDCSVGGLNLLDLFCGYERIIVLDACVGAGAPGAWWYGTAAALRETAHLGSVHDVNFATALALGRALGIPLPDDRDIHLFGVTVENATTFDWDLSPALARAYPALCAAIFATVQQLLESAAVAGRIH